MPHSKSKEVANIALPCVEAPIGVFDSGVGGLSVLRKIRAELPKEDLIYVTDARHAPYGDQSHHFIRQRATAIIKFFIRNDSKSIVVACNTATAVGIQQLRSQFDIPLVAIEPAVKPAAKTTRLGVIGILATPLTLESERFVNLLTQYGKDTEVLVQPCPGLVEQVEKASFDNGATKALLKEYVSPLIQQGADTIVLGCTHYSFLKPAIVSIVGSGVSIIDPANAVAQELRRLLTANRLLSKGKRPQTVRFWTTDSIDEVESVISLLWNESVQVHSLPTDSVGTM